MRREDDNNYYSGYKSFGKSTVKAGITFGSCLAMVISFVTWKSIFWAIVHGALSWVYIIYFIIKY